MSNVKSKLKTYNEITGFAATARRYFVNNFYDGNLTVLGVLLGFFVVVLKDPTQPTIQSAYIILTGVGTSISMLISGISGSYLSEKAEQRKIKSDLEKAMGLQKTNEIKLTDTLEGKEIQKAMLKKINIKKKIVKKKDKKVEKTVHEKAESFAGIVVSIVNGGAPFLGGLIPLIPFLLTKEAGIMSFISSFIIIFSCIILLGILLGRISKESIIKNIFQMLVAFTLTMVIVVLFLG